MANSINDVRLSPYAEEVIQRNHDPDNRDPNNLNKHLQLDFFNVFGEPDESSYSFFGVHDFSQKVYYYSKIFIYRLLTSILSIPLMICWGLALGTYSFIMIWGVAPGRRLFQAMIAEAGIYAQAASDAVFAPIFRSYAYVFSRIQVNVQNNQSKVNIV